MSRRDEASVGGGGREMEGAGWLAEHDEGRAWVGAGRLPILRLGGLADERARVGEPFVGISGGIDERSLREPGVEPQLHGDTGLPGDGRVLSSVG